MLAAPFLVVCHAAFTAQRTVIEVEKKVGSFLNGNMMMHGEVLAVLEGLEAVYDDLTNWCTVLHKVVVQQHAVTSEAGDVAIYGLGTDFEVSGDLAAGHATGGLHKDELVEVWSLLPVRVGKSLAAEGAFAGFTKKPLYTLWGNLSPEGANLLVGPSGR